MINGHGDDAYRYTAIRANFSSNVYHRVNHDLSLIHISEPTRPY